MPNSLAKMKKGVLVGNRVTFQREARHFVILMLRIVLRIVHLSV